MQQPDYPYGPHIRIYNRSPVEYEVRVIELGVWLVKEIHKDLESAQAAARRIRATILENERV